MTARASSLLLSGAAAIALTSSFGVSAQQRPATSPSGTPPLVIQVGVDLVQIDASITDKQGRPVASLRPEDFTLEVDGRKVPITNTAYYGDSSSKRADAVQPETAAPESSASTVVFVIDDLNMSFGSMHATRRAIDVFATEIASSRPLVALRLTSDESDMLSFFRSAGKLAASAKELRYNMRSSKGIRSQATSPFGTMTTTSALNRATSSVDWLSNLTPTEERLNLEQRTFSLTSTLNTLRGLPGRKAVVFVSEGFYVDNRDRDHLDAGLPFGSLFGDPDISAALRVITEVANRASVVLYTVDPRGLTVDSPDASDNVSAQQATQLEASRRDERMGSQASLQYLADDTGGLAIANRNDLQGGFGDVLRDQGAYYLIGFEPPEKTFVKTSGRPKFHKIKLSVNLKNVRVRTRAGFYGVTDQEVIERAPVISVSPTTY